MWPLNNWGGANPDYNKTVGDWEFNYEEQGPWNYKELYHRRLNEARLYAKDLGWELIINDTLEGS